MTIRRTLLCFFCLFALGAADSLRAQTTLTPSASYVPTDLETGETEHRFGFDAVIEGDLIVVGAPYADSDATGSLVANSGKVYIYDQSSSTPATPIHVIDNPTPAAEDQFGYGVAIQGDQLAVGCFEEVAGKSGAGVVYLYDISGATPTVTLTISNPFPDEGEQFGNSLDFDGTLLAVGCWNELQSGDRPGRAYVFDLAANPATDPVFAFHQPGLQGGNYARFGHPVKLENKILAVGAYNTGHGAARGRVLVYDLNVLSLPEWYNLSDGYFHVTETGVTYVDAYPRLLLIPPVPSWRNFGLRLDLDSGRLVVGHEGYSIGADNVGRAYLYDLNSQVPIEGAQIGRDFILNEQDNTPDLIFDNPAPTENDYFGGGVAIRGDRVVVGSFREDADGTDSGRAYVYDLGIATPTTPEKVIPNPTPQVSGFDDFGYRTVTMSGDTLLIGAYRDNVAGTDNGVLHLFDVREPDISLSGNGVEISTGDDTPEAADDTDFGTQLVETGIVTRTFTITNTGGLPLNLTGAAPDFVTISGSAAFSVTAQPTGAAIPTYGGTETFEVSFDPVAAGVATATVSIASDDPNESPFIFDLTGFGLEAVIQVDGDGEVISNGDDTPDAAGLTEFGEIPVLGGQVVRQFTISNLGDADLNLTGTAPDLVTLAGSDAFEVTAQPASPIAPAGSQTFEITFDPSAEGAAVATVSIVNNDPDATPFTFAIQGTGLIPEISIDEFGSEINSGGTIDFGDVPIEGGGPTRVITLSNAGLAELSLTGPAGMAVELSGGGAFQLVSQPHDLDLGPGDAQYFGVRFDPFVVGPQTATITIESNDLDIDQFTIQLTGNGIAGTQTGQIPGLSIPAPHAGTEVGFAGTHALAIEGSLLAVGAPGSDTGAENAGEVYLFDLAGETPLNPVAVIQNPLPESDDRFGSALDLDGGRLVIGAPGKNDAWGAVYLYDVSAAVPTFLYEFQSHQADSGDEFGYSVAIDGDYVAAGSPYWDWASAGPYNINQGQILLYDLSSATPTIYRNVFRPTRGNLARYGISLGLDGSIIAAGRGDFSGDGGYVVVYDASQYTERQRVEQNIGMGLLEGPDGESGDRFGESLAVHGTKILVGAPGRDPTHSSEGEAFLFDVMENPPFTPIETFTAPHPIVNGRFGLDVAMAGDRAMIAARGDDTSADAAGAAWYYDLLDPGDPTMPAEEYLNPDADANDEFGSSLAFSEDFIVVGAPQDDSAGTDMGAVYIYAAPTVLSVTQGDQVILPDATGTLEVEVTGGTPPIALQWYRGEVGDTSDPVPGANSETLSVGPLSAGLYPFWLRASSVAGIAATPTLTVTVPAMPEFTGDLTPSVDSGSAFVWRFETNVDNVAVEVVELPAWLELLVTEGQISGIYGTRIQPGTFTVDFLLSDAYYQDVPASISISVNAIPPVIRLGVDGGFAAGRSGVRYAHEITSIGGGVSYVATGLPDNDTLTIDPTSGVISGTPEEEGTYSVTITATNSVGSTSVTSDLVIEGPYLPPMIQSASAEKIDAGEDLDFVLRASDAPMSFEVESPFPTWLSFDESTGRLTGSTNLPDFYELRVRAIGPGGIGDWAELEIQVCPLPGAPRINSLASANGRVGEAFAFQPTTDDPAAPGASAWSAEGLPPGIAINATSGELSSTPTPTQAGHFESRLRAANAIGFSMPQRFYLNIAPPPMVPEITSAPIIEQEIHVPIDFTFTATQSPTEFEFLNLHENLTQDGTAGRITGVFTEHPGSSYSFYVTARNGDGPGLSQRITIKIVPAEGAPEITGLSETEGYVGQPFSSAIQATNDPTSFVALDPLPAGLTLEETSGVIGGVPDVIVGQTPYSTRTELISKIPIRVQATNNVGDSEPVEVELSFTAAPGAPRILTRAIGAAAGEPLSARLETTVDDVTSFSVLLDQLPDGVAFDPISGVFSGTPQERTRYNGQFGAYISASNSEGTGPVRSISLHVSNPNIAFGLSYPALTVGSAVDLPLDVSSIVPIQSYRLEGLPNGLEFDPAHVRIIGRPLVAGRYPLTITANTEFGSREKEIALSVVPRVGDYEVVIPEIIYWGKVGQINSIDFPIRRVGDTEIAGYWGDSNGEHGGWNWDAPDFPGEAELYRDSSAGRVKFTAKFDRQGEARLRVWSNTLGFSKTVTLIAGREQLPSGPLVTGPSSYRTNFHSIPGLQIASENRTLTSQFYYRSPVTGVRKSIPLDSRSGIPTMRDRILPQRFFAGAQELIVGVQNSLKDQPSEFPVVLDVGVQADTVRIAKIGSIYRSGKVGNLIALNFKTWKGSGVSFESRTFETLELWVKDPVTGYFDFFTRSTNRDTVDFKSLEPGVFEAFAFGTTTLGEKSGSQKVYITVSNDAGTHVVEGIVPADGAGAAPPAPRADLQALAFAPPSDEGFAPPPASGAPLGRVGELFSAQVVFNEAVVSVLADGLPRGLNYDENSGEIGGYPEEPGLFEVTFTAIDGDFNQGISTHAIEILPAVGAPVFTDTPPAAVAGEPWSWTPAVSNEAATLLAQDLPGWLRLDHETMTLSGMFPLPGEESITLRAANVEGITAWEPFSVVVARAAGTPDLTAPTALVVDLGDTLDHTVAVGDFGDYLFLEGIVPGTSWDGTMGTLSGMADAAGAYELSLRGENSAGLGARVNWTVLVREALPDAFQEYTDAAGLSGKDAAYDAIPFDEGVSNLLKFAFNMDGSAADFHEVTPGSGSSGLPFSSVTSNGAGATIRIEFIRRRTSTLVYTPMFSTDLIDFQPGTGQVVERTPIDAFYEQVIWEETVAAGIPRLFWQIQVSEPESSP